ncbi:alpha/beta fold hydrolase [Methylobacterium sp. 13MFTsu3.1M2]|uniref:alpha/beta fold hydrolase n=1 Tax=Methylobacterium sp. 13MFTsu3.1M2 TaxID=1502776 RepID=UPI0008E8B411|nr:alpha/beta fold hydrolase [Methylobacterium sp. 13MFTsu3.1M2]SFE56503.1 Pimeloyl-ACP methyl ester carboxylesterase [Methylobacterium sp. 13MFTsu3.1M2]
MNLVLLPGFMTDADLWSDVVARLAEVGPITHGDLARDAAIADMARRVVAEAPPRFGLVGFSMGGYVARAVARLVPDRVEALVLVATSSRADTPAQARRKAAAVAHIRQQGYRGLSRSAILQSVHPDRAGDGALLSRIRQMGDRLGGEVFLRQAGQARESDGDRLGAIGCPTLVVAAAQDALRSLDEARELRDGIPGATLRVIDGSGHMLPLEGPDAMADAIVPWLRAQASGASTIGS